MKHNIILLLFLLVSVQIFSQKLLTFTEALLPKPQVIDTAVNNFNQHQSQYYKLSLTEKEFYYWINYSRTNPQRFYDSVIKPVIKIYPQLKGENVNSLKKDVSNISNLPMLNLNQDLIVMAANQAKDITSHNSSPSHNSTNGNSFTDRFKENNLKRCGAENISYGENEPLFLIALLYIDLNISDLGHRKNMLNPTFTETGIGASFYKDGNVFIVEDFACPQN